MKKKILVGLFMIIFVVVALVGIAMNVSMTMTIEHRLKIPIDKAWVLWNDPNIIQKWWGPDGYSAPVVKNDPRVGGKILLSMRGPDGKDIFNVGEYTEVRVHELLISKLSFADNAGNPVPAKYYELPGKWPDEIVVRVHFEEFDAKETVIQVTEEGLPMIMYVFAKMGWKQQFRKMEKFLTTPLVMGM